MITLEEVIEDVQGIIAEVGEDYVYPISDKVTIYSSGIPVCVYKTEDGNASCIVGRILDRHGFLDHAKEGKSVGQLEVITDNFTKQAKEFMTDLQICQDDNIPWGTAFEIALEGNS